MGVEPPFLPAEGSRPFVPSHEPARRMVASAAVDLSVELESVPQAGHQVRQLLAERLRDQFSENALAALLAVVTELVNNSVVHGPGGPIQVSITLVRGAALRGKVEDQGQGADVVIGESRDVGAGGLGLRIVDALAERWAVPEGSTSVWFEMPRL